MRERPIIFSTESVKAILDGRKTQTRRVVKDPRRYSREREASLAMSSGRPSMADLQADLELSKDTKPNYPCPYGQVGDRLWVRETYAVRLDGVDQIMYKSDYNELVKMLDLPKCDIRWKPSIHMFHKDSRITLEITGVRVERIQEITEEDAEAEGINGYQVKKFSYGNNYRVFKSYHKEYYPLVDHADIGDIVRFQGPNMGFACFQSRNPKCKGGTLNIDAKESFNYVGAIEPDYKNGFEILWNSLNAKRGYGWETNPWVWCISFKKL